MSLDHSSFNRLDSVGQDDFKILKCGIAELIEWKVQFVATMHIVSPASYIKVDCCPHSCLFGGITKGFCVDIG